MASIIAREELKAKMDKGAATVVEVLPAEAFERAHLPGARNIPVSDIKKEAPAMLPDKSAEIVVYCSGPT
jgi:rhodanese-related sulfurtransferase